jgi:hypothetical protein
MRSPAAMAPLATKAGQQGVAGAGRGGIVAATDYATCACWVDTSGAGPATCFQDTASTRWMSKPAAVRHETPPGGGAWRRLERCKSRHNNVLFIVRTRCPPVVLWRRLDVLSGRSSVEGRLLFQWQRKELCTSARAAVRKSRSSRPEWVLWSAATSQWNARRRRARTRPDRPARNERSALALRSRGCLIGSLFGSIRAELWRAPSLELPGMVRVGTRAGGPRGVGVGQDAFGREEKCDEGKG